MLLPAKRIGVDRDSTMGPTCQVLLDSLDERTLDAIDRLLSKASERIEKTRKGRVWDIWIKGSPFHVSASAQSVELSAGCSSPEDAEVLKGLADELACVLSGIAAEPTK